MQEEKAVQKIHQANRERQVLLFTRYPHRGQVKTRLIAALGAEGAAQVHVELTEQLIQRLRPLQEELSLRVYFCGSSQEAMRKWLGAGILFFPQEGDDLGQRMHNALQQSWEQGATQAVLIGSDCPGLTGEHIQTALKALTEHDVVLGPAVDGGYYLLGMNAFCPSQEHLFHGINWGTGLVLQQTLARIADRGLSWTLLPKLHDIDRPEDLVHFHYHSRSQ
jgi:rSAM/selenodomain-associated transferase 1